MAISKLPTSASLKQVMDKFEEISLQDFSSIDIITASELPGQGKEGQVCIITNVYTDDITASVSIDDRKTVENSIFIQLETFNNDKYFTINKGNTNLKQYVLSVTQYIDSQFKKLESYVFKNGSWVKMSVLDIYFFKDGVFPNLLTTGQMTSDSNTYLNISDVIQLKWYTGYYLRAYSEKKINITDYSKLTFKIKSCVTTNASSSILLGICSTLDTHATLEAYYSIASQTLTDKTIEIDISNLKGDYYIKVNGNASSYSNLDRNYINISEIHLS